MRGALHLFRGHEVVILNDRPERGWLNTLSPDPNIVAHVTESPGPLHTFADQFRPDDIMVVIGADVLDGTYGPKESLERIDLMMRALVAGLKIYVTFSFRSNVAPEILEGLRLLSGVVFLLRDDLSLKNFQDQVGLKCRFFPDFSFFCPSRSGADVESALAKIEALRGDGPVLGVNGSEQSFRSFSADHGKQARRRFVGSILSQLTAKHPDARFVFFSSDRRGWRGHSSDQCYQVLAKAWVLRNLGPGRAICMPRTMDYRGNIALLAAVEVLVTGRMHLALAAGRSGVLPIVLMGQSQSFTSVNKMLGALDTYFGTAEYVLSDIERLALASVEGLDQHIRRRTARKAIDVGRDESNAHHATWLRADIQRRDRSAEGGDDLRAALNEALSALIRQSEALALERGQRQALETQIANRAPPKTLPKWKRKSILAFVSRLGAWLAPSPPPSSRLPIRAFPSEVGPGSR